MTYRERRLAKAARLQEWAEKRQTAAAAQLNSHPEIRHDWAFITQPGHIPFRARMNAADSRAFESIRKADRMAGKAAEIERQVDRAIYDDDPDAVEALEAKVRELTAKRDRMSRINRLYRKGDVPALMAEGYLPSVPEQAVAEFEKLKADIAERYSWERKGPFRSYEMSNLGGVISKTKQRIASVKARQADAAATEAAGGVRITEQVSAYGGETYATVQFSEKPDRSVIDALKEAGFRWSSGSWYGKAAQVPEMVRSMVKEG